MDAVAVIAALLADECAFEFSLWEPITFTARCVVFSAGTVVLSRGKFVTGTRRNMKAAHSGSLWALWISFRTWFQHSVSFANGFTVRGFMKNVFPKWIFLHELEGRAADTSWNYRCSIQTGERIQLGITLTKELWNIICKVEIPKELIIEVVFLAKTAHVLNA